MPSPFPGMDPYLEGSLWMSVHAQLAFEIARQLTPRLVPRYVALIGQRFVVATPEATEDLAITSTSMYPDAAIVGAGATGSGQNGGVAVAHRPNCPNHQ